MRPEFAAKVNLQHCLSCYCCWLLTAWDQSYNCCRLSGCISSKTWMLLLAPVLQMTMADWKPVCLEFNQVAWSLTSLFSTNTAISETRKPVDGTIHLIWLDKLLQFTAVVLRYFASSNFYLHQQTPPLGGHECAITQMAMTVTIRQLTITTCLLRQGRNVLTALYLRFYVSHSIKHLNVTLLNDVVRVCTEYCSAWCAALIGSVRGYLPSDFSCYRTERNILRTSETKSNNRLLLTNWLCLQTVETEKCLCLGLYN